MQSHAQLKITDRLVEAIKNNQGDEVALLLDQGASTHWIAPNGTNNTLVHLAALHGATHALQVLKDKRPQFFNDALRLRNNYNYNNHNSLDGQSDTPLTLALKNNRNETAAWLINQEADVTSWRDQIDPNETVLHLAAKNGSINVLELIKNKYPEFFITAIHLGGLAVDSAGDTPVVLALKNNQNAAAAWLLNHGAVATVWRNLTDPNETLLHLAAKSGGTEVLQIIKSRNPEFVVTENIHFATKEGIDVLGFAINGNKSDTVAWLLKNGAKAKWRHPKISKFTIVHQAAKAGATETLAIIKTIDPNLVTTCLDLADKNGATPLEHALQQGKDVTAAWLINNGANVTLRYLRDNHLRPFKQRSHTNDIPISFSVLHLAAMVGATETLREIKTKHPEFFATTVDVSVGEKGLTPLVLAIDSNNEYAACWLVRNGAKLNWRLPTDQNYTIVTRAAESTAFYVLAVIVTVDSDFFRSVVNLPDSKNNTAVDYAAKLITGRNVLGYIPFFYKPADEVEAHSRSVRATSRLLENHGMPSLANHTAFFNGQFTELYNRQCLYLNKDARFKILLEALLDMIMNYNLDAQQLAASPLAMTCYRLAQHYVCLRYNNSESPLHYHILATLLAMNIGKDPSGKFVVPIYHFQRYLDSVPSQTWLTFCAWALRVNIAHCQTREDIENTLWRRSVKEWTHAKQADRIHNAILNTLERKNLELTTKNKEDLRHHIVTLLADRTDSSLISPRAISMLSADLFATAKTESPALRSHVGLSALLAPTSNASNQPQASAKRKHDQSPVEANSEPASPPKKVRRFINFTQARFFGNSVNADTSSSTTMGSSQARCKFVFR